jgi:type I restriction enzyme M protein
MGRRRAAGDMSFPAQYQLPSFRAYKKAPGTPELDDQATTADFRAIASSFHSEFFAEHPDSEIFTSIVKLLLAKIFDERSRRPGEQYEFQVLQRNGREETAASLLDRIVPLYERAYAAYIDPAGGDTLDPKVFAPERVKSVVKGLQGVAITRGAALHGDVIGAFFEEILRAGFKQDKGMYFTHANLVWFMLEALDLTQLTQDTWQRATHPNDRMPYVIDPSCGSGTFLLRAMQMMSAAIRDNRATLVQTQDDETYYNSHLSDQNPNDWAKDYLYGSDPKFVMAITAKVNMVLHGDGSAHVYKWDSLRPLTVGPDRRLQPLPAGMRSVPVGSYPPEVSEQFDVVVSNPPFGITLAPETQKAVPTTFTLGTGTSSESLFLERYAQLLKPRGRLGVVVPESLLNAGDYRESRRLLFRFFHVRAVVSLPRNLFVETPTLTSLLFAQKKTQDEILTWDADWAANRTLLEHAVVRAKNDMKTAARAPGATPADVAMAFNATLGQHIEPDAFVKKRGRAPAVLSARLPESVASATEAMLHYEAFLKASGFQYLQNQAILKLMLANHDYDWPAYAVDEVGFKLSKRGERIRPNQLIAFQDGTGTERPNVQKADAAVTPVVDVTAPVKVLDYLRRDVTWL